MRDDLATIQAFLVLAVKGDVPIPSHPTLAAAAPRFVTGNARLRPVDQVDIYRRQFWFRHRGVMRDDLPGLVRVLGDDVMDAFCRAYLDAFPPNDVSFRVMIQHVPRLLETFDGIEREATRALAFDMARYELALLDLRVGGEVPPLDPQKLAGLPEDAWEKARIVLHPLLARFRFSYPVHRVRKAWMKGEEMAVPDAPSPSPIHLALYRTRELVTHFEELEPEAFALLAALAEGLPLVPALDRVAKALPEDRQAFVMANVGAWFQQWTAWGIVVDVDLG